MQPAKHLDYRPDIDGLRAFAVLLVILFHAFPALLPGGFIGVDVFFVISGFLITKIIVHDLEKGSFTIANFYRRRILRIFPALLFVLLFCIAIGWLILLPEEYSQLGNHISNGAIFLANFALKKESGYFDVVAETKPLLHLWSLGIEEQFYLAWPLLVFLCCKKKWNLFRFFLALALLSFCINIYLMKKDGVADFYLPQSRFWELALGAMLSRLDSSLSERKSQIYSVLGFFLMGLGLWAATKVSVFPGFAALFPTLGAALIVFAGTRSRINSSILSNPIVTYIGLISYPLYLWHWPILSFARIMEGSTPSIASRIFALALALLASLVTYHAVEKPIRFRWAYRHKVFLLFAAMVLVAILGRLVKQKTIHPRSASLPYVNILELRPDYPTPPGAVADPGGNFGMIGKNPKRAILLAGDSHAAQYRLTMARLGAEAMRSQPEGPRAMYSLDYFDPRTLPRLLPFILKDSSIESVVLSNFWAFVYGSNRINYAVRCCMGGVGRMVGGASYQDPPPEAELAQIDSALESSIRKLVSSGKKVFLVLDNPFGEELMPKTFIRRGLLGGVELLPKEARVAGLSKALALERTEPTRSRVSRIALRSGATLIDPVATLCASENCMIRAENGWPIYKDYDHLSPQSSEQLVRYLDFLFR